MKVLGHTIARADAKFSRKFDALCITANRVVEVEFRTGCFSGATQNVSLSVGRLAGWQAAARASVRPFIRRVLAQERFFNNLNC